MKLVGVVLCVWISTVAFAQTPATDLKTLSLPERYQLLKSTSQTYQEYKVIKEIILDKEWKIFRDSLQAVRNTAALSRAEGKRIQAELEASQLTLKQKEASMAATSFAAEHIEFLALDFNKKVFIGMTVTTTAILVLAIILLTGRVKLMLSDIKSKSAAVSEIAGELEEYKRKALEKQTKLSRELQNERNRLQELRNG
jgi:hypothetical protein